MRTLQDTVKFQSKIGNKEEGEHADRNFSITQHLNLSLFLHLMVPKQTQTRRERKIHILQHHFKYFSISNLMLSVYEFTVEFPTPPFVQTQKVRYFTKKLVQLFQLLIVIVWGRQQKGLGEGMQKVGNDSEITQIQGAIISCDLRTLTGS